MKTRSLKFSGLMTLTAGLSLMAASALAQPIYLNGASPGDPISFIGHYDGVQSGMGTNMGNCYSCYICHNAFPENATNLTQYAMDFRAAWVALEPARTIDEAPNANAMSALSAIESKDSDGDGASNIQEIQANSNPGDSKSTPSAAGTCPNAPTQSGGGGSASSASSSAPYNANSLNAKCGSSSMAGLLKTTDTPAQDAETVALFFLPLLTLLGLRSWIPSARS